MCAHTPTPTPTHTHSHSYQSLPISQRLPSNRLPVHIHHTTASQRSFVDFSTRNILYWRNDVCRTAQSGTPAQLCGDGISRIYLRAIHSACTLTYRIVFESDFWCNLLGALVCQPDCGYGGGGAARVNGINARSMTKSANYVYRQLGIYCVHDSPGQWRWPAPSASPEQHTRTLTVDSALRRRYGTAISGRRVRGECGEC